MFVFIFIVIDIAGAVVSAHSAVVAVVVLVFAIVDIVVVAVYLVNTSPRID